MTETPQPQPQLQQTQPPIPMSPPRIPVSQAGLADATTAPTVSRFQGIYPQQQQQQQQSDFNATPVTNNGASLPGVYDAQFSQQSNGPGSRSQNAL